MGMKTYEELKDMLCKELDEIAERGELSAGSLDTVHKLTDTIKNIGKIEMLEDIDDYGDYSNDDGMEADRMYNNGNSYARGGRRRGTHYVRGHYSRDDGTDGGYSRRRGGYSRDDGKAYMMEQLDDMIDNASTEREREALRNCKTKIQNA